MSPEPQLKETIHIDAADGTRGTGIDDILPFVYGELHRQAHRYLRRERSNHTLQTTALINEVYLRLAAQKEMHWQNRAQFFGIAANMMRRILVDYAKTRHRSKRVGSVEVLSLDEPVVLEIETPDEKNRIDLILLDLVLTKLGKLDERQARIVELRYFSGLTVEETAEILNLSHKTIIRDWKMAKAWLSREMNSEESFEERELGKY